MYSWSPNLSQISLKNSFGKMLFQIFAEIEMQIGYLAAILKRSKYFIFFFLKYGCDYCNYIWCKDNLKIPVGKWFS